MGLVVYFRKKSCQCLKARTYKLSLVCWIPLQVCNLRCFTSQRALPVQLRQQKPYAAYRGRTTFHLLPSSEMLHASQVNSAKAAVRLPTAVQPACVPADPQTCTCQQRKVQKLWHLSMLTSHLSSYFQEKSSPKLILSLIFYYCFCIIGQFIKCLHTA